MTTDARHIVTSALLADVEGLVHGFSTRRDGDMREAKNRARFLTRLGISPDDLVFGRQVHSTHVTTVSQRDRGTMRDKSDGLVYLASKSKREAVCLAVRTADCVPVLLVDPVGRVIAVAHAGWKGTTGNISANVVLRMRQLGACASRILVTLGPRIGECCYNVSWDRASRFIDVFGEDSGIAVLRSGRWLINLGKANVIQLVACGILPHHIDAMDICTSCQHTSYFSYRKDGTKTFGEIMGVLSFR